MSDLSHDANDVLSRAFARLETAFGTGKKSLRGGMLSLRYPRLPAGSEGLAPLLESLGAKVDYAIVAPVSLRAGGGLRLESAGSLDGVRFLASGAGELGEEDVLLTLYVDSKEAASTGDRTLFEILDRIFAAPGVDNLLARYIGHSLDTLGPKAAKRLARDMAESLADYLAP